jgi:exodeoxyribonuclease V beta subunit
MDLAPRASEAPLALEAAEFDIDDTRGDVASDELPPGAASGLLLHDLLEVADLERVRHAPDAAAWAADPAVAEDLSRAARARGIAESYLPHAARVVHATLTRPLALLDGGEMPALAEAPALAREVEFAFPLPGRPPVRGLARGFIDVLVAWDDALWVLDYKSDVLAGDDLGAAARARVAERYSVQMRIYALAAARLRGARRLAGLLFAFVRHGIVVPVRTSDEMIAGWSTWLATLAEGRP